MSRSLVLAFILTAAGLALFLATAALPDGTLAAWTRWVCDGCDVAGLTLFARHEIAARRRCS